MTGPARFRRPAAAFLLSLSLFACEPDSGSTAHAAPGPDSASRAEAAAPTPAPRVTVDGLEIEDLVVPEPVTGERTALFLTLRSEAGDTLLAVEADGADASSLHRTTMEDGVMRMRPIEGIPIPAGEPVGLRPGGLHGMLEELSATWSVGDTVRLRLTFARAGVVEASALVVPYAELDARFGRDAGTSGPGGH